MQKKSFPSEHLFYTLQMFFGLAVGAGVCILSPFIAPEAIKYIPALIPVAFILFLGFLWRPLSYRLHKKGFTPPIFSFFLVFLYGGPAILAAFLLFSEYFSSSDLASMSLGSKSILAVLVSLVGPIASFLLVALLPRRNWRMWGDRQAVFPFRLAAHLAWMLGAAWFLIAWLILHNVAEGIRGLIGLFVPASVFLFYLARRQNLPTLDSVVSKDRRPPVVYLRSFSQEGLPFVYVVGDELKQYTANFMNNYKVSLEQYLSRTITETIGPFVALGNPEDYLAPEGAFRAYASDKEWQNMFCQLAKSAAIILMQTGRSDNLKWELNTIRSAGLHGKLLIITPPARLSGWIYSYVNLGRWIDDLQQRLAGGLSNWKEFSRILLATGYQLPAREPGPGAILAFNETGQGVTLCANAFSPQDYVSAIQKWLNPASSMAAS